MTETIAFEDRIAEQLRAYAAPAARPPRREAVANAVEAARNVHGGIRGGLRWPTLGRRQWRSPPARPLSCSQLSASGS